MLTSRYSPLAAALALLLLAAGCTTMGEPFSSVPGDDEPCVTNPDAPTLDEPCVTRKPETTDFTEIPRYATNSPFGGEFKPAKTKQGKRMWAKSYLYTEAPKLVVEKWIGDKPDTKGKYVLIEFWATWCPPCRRSITLLNGFHRKFGEELVVIGISDETEADVLKLFSPDRKPLQEKIEYFNGIDTQARMKDEMGVWGIPHAVILEPEGFVVWEGFPLLKDYDLTDEIIEKILAVGRKLRAEAAAGQ